VKTTDQETAIETSLDRLAGLIDAVASRRPGAGVKDLDGWASALKSDLPSPVDSDALDQAITTAREIMVTVERLVARGTGNDMAARPGLQRIPIVRALLVRAAHHFSQQPELDKARNALVEAEAAHAQLETQVEAAIKEDNVDRVLDLRADLAVRSPKRVAEARLRVLDLEIKRAEEVAEGPRQRAEEVAARTVNVVKAVEDARVSLELAVEAARLAQQDASAARTFLSRLESRVADLRTERDQLEAATKTAGTAALRRVAGLPSGDTADAKTDASSGQPEHGRLVEVMR